MESLLHTNDSTVALRPPGGASIPNWPFLPPSQHSAVLCIRPQRHSGIQFYASLSQYAICAGTATIQSCHNDNPLHTRSIFKRLDLPFLFVCGLVQPSLSEKGRCHMYCMSPQCRFTFLEKDCEASLHPPPGLQCQRWPVIPQGPISPSSSGQQWEGVAAKCRSF